MDKAARNEGRKLRAMLLNGTAVAVLASGVIARAVQLLPGQYGWSAGLLALLSAAALHGLALRAVKDVED